MGCSRRRGPFRSWRGVALLVALATCRDALPPDALVLAAGDRLLDHAGRLGVDAWPESCLPTGVARRLAALWSAPPVVLPPEAWVGGAPTPLPPGVTGLDPALERRRFRISPPVRTDLAAGRPVLHHAGRRARWIAVEPLDLAMQWIDDEGQTLFWWDEIRGDLLALAPEPPGEVSLSYATDPAFGLALWERAAVGAATPRTAEELVSVAEVRREQQRVLPAPAGSRFVLEVDRLDAGRLHLRCAVPDTGLGWEPPVEPIRGTLRDADAGHRRLTRRRQQGDGVVFGVAVIDDAGVRHGVWGRRVQSVDGWVDAVVDLAAWRGASLQLELSSAAGTDGDADFDHGLWADLRLEGGARRHEQRPHLLLIQLSGWRPDRSTPWGAARDTMPRLAAWAEAGLRCDDVLAAASSGLPATASLLTGRHVGAHGLLDARARLAAGVTTAAQRLASHGYRTRALAQGVDLATANGLAAGTERRTRVLDADPATWLEALPDLDGARPLFLHLQTHGGLPPWPVDTRFGRRPPAPFGERTVNARVIDAVRDARGGRLGAEDVGWIRALYDAALWRADRQLGALFEALDERAARDPRARPCLVLVVGDRGQALGEGDRVLAGQGLDASDLAVPWVARWLGPQPASLPALAGVDASPRATVDVLPSLLRAAGLSPDPDLPGSDIFSPAPPDRIRRALDPAGRRTALAGGWQVVTGPDPGSAPAWRRWPAGPWIRDGEPPGTVAALLPQLAPR